jgi:hypothetical protein
VAWRADFLAHQGLGERADVKAQQAFQLRLQFGAEVLHIHVKMPSRR